MKATYIGVSSLFVLAVFASSTVGAQTEGERDEEVSVQVMPEGCAVPGVRVLKVGSGSVSLSSSGLSLGEDSEVEATSPLELSAFEGEGRVVLRPVEPECTVGMLIQRHDRPSAVASGAKVVLQWEEGIPRARFKGSASILRIENGEDGG